MIGCILRGGCILKVSCNETRRQEEEHLFPHHLSFIRVGWCVPVVDLLVLFIETRPDLDRANELCKFRCSVRMVAAFNTLVLTRSQYQERKDMAQRHFNLASFSLVAPRSVETLVICLVHAVVCLTNWVKASVYAMALSTSNER